MGWGCGGEVVGEWGRGVSCGWGGERCEEGVDVACAFLLHGFVGGDGGGELGCWGVDGGEGEDVEEEEAAVVQEMADGAAC